CLEIQTELLRRRSTTRSTIPARRPWRTCRSRNPLCCCSASAPGTLPSCKLFPPPRRARGSSSRQLRVTPVTSLLQSSTKSLRIPTQMASRRLQTADECNEQTGLCCPATYLPSFLSQGASTLTCS